jgi:hypothetical protein
MKDSRSRVLSLPIGIRSWIPYLISNVSRYGMKAYPLHPLDSPVRLELGRSSPSRFKLSLVGFINLLSLVLVNDSIVIEACLLSGNLGFSFNVVAVCQLNNMSTIEATY